MTILIIDDDNFVRMLTRVSLSKVGGMTVVEAASGADGLATAAQLKPDVILLDVMMPGMDGPDTLKALRAEPATAAIPIIFLTAKAMPGEQARLSALGAAAVFTKPFDPLKLGDEVRRVVSELGGQAGNIA